MRLGPLASLSGFTIRTRSGGSDGAVHVNPGRGCRISDNVIVNNLIGVVLADSDASVFRNRFTGNARAIVVRRAAPFHVAENVVAGSKIALAAGEWTGSSAAGFINNTIVDCEIGVEGGESIFPIVANIFHHGRIGVAASAHFRDTDSSQPLFVDSNLVREKPRDRPDPSARRESETTVWPMRCSRTTASS